jgi:hypothetical protein
VLYAPTALLEPAVAIHATDLRYADDREPATECPNCKGDGWAPRHQWRTTVVQYCDECGGVGFLGIDPSVPTVCSPGSREKVAILTARRNAGFYLWNNADAADFTSGLNANYRHDLRRPKASLRENKET